MPMMTTKPRTPRSPSDRRAFVRADAVANSACLEWWEGTQARVSPAAVLEISRGGAKLICDQRPPLDRRVWLRVEEPAAESWVEARVVRHVGAHGAALEFERSCPYDLRMALTQGISLDGLFAG